MSKDRYWVVTYGCQMNEYDSEVIKGYLEENGFIPAENEREADLYLINTCAVREKAEKKVLSRLGTLRQFKEQNPDSILVLLGCMIQQKGMAEYLKKRFPFIDLLLGPQALSRFPILLEEVRKNKKTVVDTQPGPRDIVFPIKRDNNIRAWVPISHGCNNYCSYCIVPYVRGKEVSKKPFLIIKEVKQLAEEGFKEIVLLGQNVNSYGQDLDSSEKIDFADLLLEVSKIEGIGHIRFMTSHPKDFSLKLIKAINERENICEHIHLPLQSGSNKILKLMNRKYTREYYLDLVNNIRKYSPETAITTDIIVGFPGEQDEDFQQTMEMVDTVKFDAAFTFVYSPRKGTPAAKFSEQVPPEIKKQRITALVKKQQEISLEKNKQYINKVLRVLVEGRSKHNKSMLTGRAGNNKIVHFPFADGLIGEFVNIKIKEARSQFLIGEKTKEGRFII